MFKKTYREWTDRTNERQKLQTIFAAVTITMVVVAGLVGLLDQSLGLSLVNIAYVAALVWVINFVAWAIYLALTTPSTTEAPRTTRRRK